MLVFADNAWHVFAGLIVFAAGLTIALSQRKIFGVPVKRATMLYLWHSFFCVFYFWYSLNDAADSTLYYLSSLDYEADFRFGTSGIYFIVSFRRD